MPDPFERPATHFAFRHFMWTITTFRFVTPKAMQTSSDQSNLGVPLIIIQRKTVITIWPSWRIVFLEPVELFKKWNTGFGCRSQKN
jgi:hypothetical protein